MKLLIVEDKLSEYKSKDLIPTECLQCKSPFYKTKGLVLRILYGDLKNTNKGNFCTKECFYKSKTKKKEFNCANCNKLVFKTVERTKKSKNIFCSQSCSAVFNNKKRGYKSEKVELNKKCVCGILIKSNRKYCTIKCQAHEKTNKTFDKIESNNYFVKSNKQYKSYLIAKRGHRCEMCSFTEWGGKPILLILDHIDGNSDNFELENLRIICSNCDTLTPTYKNRNKGKGRFARRQRYRDGKSF